MNNEYEIIVDHTPVGYCATLEDFDGADDATGPCSFVGRGFTDQAARDDLNEQLSQWAVEERAEHGEYLRDQRRDREMGL